MPLHQQITEADRIHLGVPTGIQGSSFALTKLTERKAEPGYLVGENSFIEWRFQGFTYLEGEAYLYGPQVEGLSLGQVIEQPDAMPYLLRLARALALLEERGIQTFRFQSEGVIFTAGGEVLFLPPTLMAIMKDSRPLEYRIRAYEAVNHPYKDGMENLSFSLGALAYRILSGSFPFWADEEQELRNQVRKLRVTPPHLIKPEITKEASEMILGSLAKPGSVTLEQWVQTLTDWNRRPPVRVVTDQEREALIAKADEHRQKAQRSLRSGVFFEKHGRLVLVLAAVAIGVGLFAGSILRNVLAPRVTAGFTPAQVVEAFYTSIGKLDHSTMEDCVIGDVGKSEVNEAVNLYVISRQTIAYEGTSFVLDAGDWEAAGRPDVNPPSFVHGVVDLQIKREQDDPAPVFLVTYERYARAFEDQEVEVTRAVNGRRIVDRCYLQKDKDDWVIYRIDRLRVRPLEESP